MLTLVGGFIGQDTGCRADNRCTNQIGNAGDLRSNAEINSIGALTGQCPLPMSQGYGLPGLVSGAVEVPTSSDSRSLTDIDWRTNDLLLHKATGLENGACQRVGVIGVRQVGALRCIGEQQLQGRQSPGNQPLGVRLSQTSSATEELKSPVPHIDAGSTSWATLDVRYGLPVFPASAPAAGHRRSSASTLVPRLRGTGGRHSGQAMSAGVATVGSRWFGFTTRPETRRYW